jgi:protein-disulfide isomerase
MRYGKINVILLSIMILLVSVMLFQINSINNKFEKLIITGEDTKDINNIKKTTDEIITEQGVIKEGNSPVKGDKNAPVTIIEFSDFQCPYCARFYLQTLPLIERDYINTGKVKLVYKHFPLRFHQYAEKAAEASECANEQGKFWEYHDIIFKNQRDLSIGNLKKWAKELALDTKKFNSCLDSGKYKSKVNTNIQEGSNAGVSGTPAFFVNGKKLVGAQPFDAFKQIIEDELFK